MIKCCFDGDMALKFDAAPGKPLAWQQILEEIPVAHPETQEVLGPWRPPQTQRSGAPKKLERPVFGSFRSPGALNGPQGPMWSESARTKGRSCRRSLLRGDEPGGGRGWALARG